MNKIVFTLLISILLAACASTNSSSNTSAIKPIKGQGTVVSILEIDKSHQEIGIKLDDGAVVPVNVPVSEQYKMNQKVYVDRPAKGSATVKSL